MPPIQCQYNADLPFWGFHLSCEPSKDKTSVIIHLKNNTKFPTNSLQLDIQLCLRADNLTSVTTVKVNYIK